MKNEVLKEAIENYQCLKAQVSQQGMHISDDVNKTGAENNA
ncbi:MULTISPECIES: hypothetical protein [Klebsiella]|nr:MULTISPECIES: hypothetical protein [Klebsiella]MCW9586548.1 hypothetical protein [Klebsiella pasteurii]MDG9985495.1 hypothetical protein [Klebsiella michiganensis]MDH0832016.1 hypothetical protein [Klebsiella michiganensis]MDH0844543.1 hypothetical protein [Klebsiella michiganensis]